MAVQPGHHIAIADSRDSESSDTEAQTTPIVSAIAAISRMFRAIRITNPIVWRRCQGRKAALFTRLAVSCLTRSASVCFR